VLCYGGGGRRRRSPGYRIKNKNPTQRCGEQKPHTSMWGKIKKPSTWTTPESNPYTLVAGFLPPGK